MHPVPNYEALKRLARQKRAQYGVTTDTLNLVVVRKIYSAEGIRIDPWTFSGKMIRAVYMCADSDPSVAISKVLPREPKLFSLVHELKHHYVDRKVIEKGQIRCGDYNANQAIEVGAEVFAAEFIYPEDEFLSKVQELDIRRGSCSPEEVVRLKRECGACVSYQFLRKRLVRLGFAQAGVLDRVQFKKLEEQLYGVPIYKQDWFKSRRAARQV